MNNKKILSVEVANKGFACVHPNLPSTHQDGWECLVNLLDSAVDEGYIPTSIIRKCSAGGGRYIFLVDLEKAEAGDVNRKDYLIKQAQSLGWDSVDNGKLFYISDVKNFLINLSEGEFSYPVADIVDNFNINGISCSEEEVLCLIKTLNFETYYDKKITYDPASVNSQFMRPMPRKVEEVIFVRPLC